MYQNILTLPMYPDLNKKGVLLVKILEFLKIKYDLSK